MGKLEQLISELENNIPHHKLAVPQISGGSVGWHIEHCLLVLNLVTSALTKSNPANYRGTFDLRRTAVMLTQKIPRGRIKAPTAVRPTVQFNEITLQEHIQLTRENLNSLSDLSAGHYFTHPFLGDFKLKPAIKFLTIHTQHHYHIIKDILKNKS